MYIYKIFLCKNIVKWCLQQVKEFLKEMEKPGFLQTRQSVAMDQPGPLQIRKSVEDLEDSIKQHLKDVDTVIVKLFSENILNETDKQQLDKYSTDGQISEHVEHLLQCIRRDKSGKHSKVFLDVLSGVESGNSINYELAQNIIRYAYNNYEEKWLEVNYHLENLIQSQHQNISDHLRQVYKVSHSLFETGMLWSSIQYQSLCNEIENVKKNKMLDAVRAGGIKVILIFVQILSEENTGLYDILVKCEHFIKAKQKLQELCKDLSDRLKRYSKEELTFYNAVTGKPLHMKYLKEGTILRLTGQLIVPKSSSKSDNKWDLGEDHFPLKDVDVLFKNSNDLTSRVTLVKGNPGSGKTVFLKRWSTEWANNHDSAEYYVMYIPFRSVKSVSLLDILIKDLNMFPEKSRPVLKYFMQDPRFADKIIFLFDGIDETHNTADRNSDINKIIQGKLHKKSKIIITTRMYQDVIDGFKPHIDNVIALTGVTKESQNSFIQHTLGPVVNKEHVITEFIDKCKSFLFEGTVFSVPIYLCLLCKLATHHWKHYLSWKDLDLPQTRHNLYKAFKRVFEDRFSRRVVKNKPNIEPHINASLKSMFFLLGRMSFHALCEEQYVFTEKDFKENFIEKDMVQKIGLFVEETIRNDNEDMVQYSFCHKTFQEYFAGLYCATEGFLPTVYTTILKLHKVLHSNKRIAMGTDNVLHGRVVTCDTFILENETMTLQEMLYPIAVCVQFAAGRSSTFAKDLFLFAVTACDIHFDDIKNTKQKYYDTQFESSLVYENQSKDLIPWYVKFLLKAKKIKHKSENISPSLYNQKVYEYLGNHIEYELKCRLKEELYNIEPVIYNSENGEIQYTSKSSIKIPDMLLSKLCQDDTFHNVIKMAGKNVNLETLKHILEENGHVKELEVSNTDMDESQMSIWKDLMAHLKTMKTLTHLGFPNCNLQTSHFYDIVTFLQDLPSLEHIDLGGNNLDKLGKEGWKHLAPFVCRVYDQLSIENNCIKQCVSSCLKRNPLVTFQNALVKSLSCFLAEGSVLKSLKIYRTSFLEATDPVMWKSFMDKLSHCSKLDHLKFSSCKLNKNFLIREIANVVSNLSISSLDLSQNEITKVSNDDWGHLLRKCTYLVSLNIASCQLQNSDHLQTLAEQLCNIAQLQRFEMARNDFGNLDIDTVNKLLTSIGSLSNLQHLDIADCSLLQNVHILALGTNLGKLKSLRYLDISKTPLDSLSVTEWDDFAFNLRNLTFMQHLLVGSCGLSSIHIRGIAGVIKVASKNFCQLNISNNKLDDISEDVWSTFCEALFECQHLRNADFSRCNLEEMHFRVLSFQIIKAQSLQVLNLMRNDLSKVLKNTWKTFSESVSKTQVSHLYLQKCYLASCPLYITHKSQLVYLELPHNKLGLLSPYDWQIFMDQLQKCDKLQYLKLSKNDLTVVHITPLGKAIEGMTHLEHLNLDQNDFSNVKEYQLQTFTKHIANCQQIKKIALSSCQLNEQFHIELLGDMITKLKQLEHLDLSGNDFSHIEKPAWQQFTSSLKQCHLLDKLNLGNCKLHQKMHFQVLTGAFLSLMNLKRLNMMGNSFKNVDQQLWLLFIKNLQNCKKLQKLNLSKCDMKMGFFWEIMGPMLITLPRLFNVVLSANSIVKIPPHICRKFLECIKKCEHLDHIDLPNIRHGNRRLSWNRKDGNTLSEVMTDWE